MIATTVTRDAQGRFFVTAEHTLPALPKPPAGSPPDLNAHTVPYAVSVCLQLDRGQLATLEEQIRQAKDPSLMPEAVEENLGDVMPAFSAHRHAKQMRLDVNPYGLLRVFVSVPTERLEGFFETIRKSAEAILGGVKRLWEVPPPLRRDDPQATTAPTPSKATKASPTKALAPSKGKAASARASGRR